VTADRAGVTVYWRPGCPYCSRLLGDLDRIGLPLTKVNIWDDAGAAATVRAVAGGNETVPTVVVGDAAMVNPRAAAVLDATRRHAPELLAASTRRALRRSRRARGRPGFSSRSWRRWDGSSLLPATPRPATTSHRPSWLRPGRSDGVSVLGGPCPCSPR
jgi:glutaredoxin-like protein